MYGRAVREGAGKPGRDTLPPNLEDSIGMLTPMIRALLLYNKKFCRSLSAYPGVSNLH